MNDCHMQIKSLILLLPKVNTKMNLKIVENKLLAIPLHLKLNVLLFEIKKKL